MAKPGHNLSPRIENRRAWHDYFIEAKLECGIVLENSNDVQARLMSVSFGSAGGRQH